MTVSAPPTASPLEKALGNLLGLSILYPERFGRTVFEAVPEAAIEATKDLLRLALELFIEDTAKYGSADSSRIFAAANGSAGSLRNFLTDLAAGATPEEPEAVLFEIAAALDKEAAAPAPVATFAAPEPEVPPAEGATVERKEKAPTAADIAEAYLQGRGEILRFWRGSFYRWTGTHYAEISGSDLTAAIISFLQEVSRKAAGARAAGEVLANVKALVFVPSHVEPPAFLDEGPTLTPGNLVPMENGIFDIEKYLAGEPPLAPCTPDLFTLHSLPYGYVPGATCPIWDEVRAENLPDPSHQQVAQEWFGLNTVPDTSFEAFMLPVGEAGTGKTLVCTVLRTMLGPASVSSIPLEAVNPARTFQLSGLVGKLANVTDDLAEVDRAAEGLLKQLVTGSPVTIEKKYGEPFTLCNRARFTFATNVLPRFADRSNGIWRRMLVLPFDQVVPEEKRDRRYLDPAWWIASGELPGVFLWALEGLRRLRARGRFDLPADCQKLRDDYKRDSNPAASFLRDNCVEEITAICPSPALYKAYSAHVRDHGHHALSEPLFAREVRRQFPLAEKTPNPVWQADGTKVRVWMGVQFGGRIHP